MVIEWISVDFMCGAHNMHVSHGGDVVVNVCATTAIDIKIDLESTTEIYWNSFGAFAL